MHATSQLCPKRINKSGEYVHLYRKSCMGTHILDTDEIGEVVIKTVN